MACIFTIVQWQVANSRLQECQTLTAEQLSEIQAQEEEIESKDIQIGNLEREVEGVKFQFYYASLAKQRYGVSDLEEYLNRWQWTEGSYVSGEFDCSEMSAYLEWRLESEGYNTLIVTGDSPFGVGKHAWLLVQTSVEGYTPVEATTYSIVYWWNTYFDSYFVYDQQFQNIQEALDYSPNEFDWWTDYSPNYWWE
jgi:hypothetical protein